MPIVRENCPMREKCENVSATNAICCYFNIEMSQWPQAVRASCDHGTGQD